ncbi:hypothetical protein [Bradyrhizobium canariense]|uniref:hypothetical protein n=1 Tax=Bradyrhizobium canariense TaxID=255045 RepID=UPI0011BAB0FE|nr:hypothetical protein [Bradyrhizobium canariense]
MTASAQQPDISAGFAKCKTIADNQARLDCLKKLLPSSDPAAARAQNTQDLWPLVVTPHPTGGREAISIMRTADTTRSDPDLAGLMIRCQEKPGFEVLLALVRPFPPLARRDIIVGSGTTQSVLHAEVSTLGTGLVLPVEPTAFTTGPWRELKELAVVIKDPEAEIHGVIPLDGLTPAMAKLSARCPTG